MRTTVILPDELMLQLERHTHEQPTTMTLVMETAILRWLAEAAQ